MTPKPSRMQWFSLILIALWCFAFSNETRPPASILRIEIQQIYSSGKQVRYREYDVYPGMAVQQVR
jgi:hypothetical protein